jgi:hypothetical protein
MWTFDRDGTVTTDHGDNGKWAATGAATILAKYDNGFCDEWKFDEELASSHCGAGKPSSFYQATRIK